MDVPKSGGSGTTNDGNTGRRFFQNASVVADVLGIDYQLTYRFYILLCTLSSFREMNPDKLQAYCNETAELYVANYPWYPMPQAVHKLLVHSHQIVRHKDIPVGMLSEEAQESSNKVFKNFREHFSCKISRTKTNEDLLRRLLCASDPVISKMRKQKVRSTHQKKLPDECNELFVRNDEE